MSEKPLVAQRAVVVDDWTAYLVAFFGEKPPGSDRISWLDWKAWSVEADGEGEWILEDPDETHKRVSKAEWEAGALPKCKPMVEGYLKWDGCSECSFEQTHFCGLRNWMQMFEMAKTVYAVGREIMGEDCE